MLVFVLNKNGKALMPCSPRKARLLLKEGKARVVSKLPFTIKLKQGSSGHKQEVVGGIDAGSRVIGSAAVSSNGKVLYQAETSLRGEEIKSKMEERRMYRRTRRARKTRYRKPRFLNRGASIAKNRLAPSVRHKIEAHLREKKKIEKILPIARWKVETTAFDIHAITNPDVSKTAWWTYQNGAKKGYYNTKAYVLSRDNYTCNMCKANKNVNLHVHHITFRSNGGTDTAKNLITLCEKCHHSLHAIPNAQEESNKLLKKLKKNTKHATEVNIISSQLKKCGWKFDETYGFETKLKREALNLQKTHYIDAVCIALDENQIVKMSESYYVKKLVSKGDYKQTSGVRSEKKNPTGKLFGLRKFDKIKTPEFEGYIKGKRSTGYFAISDITGKETIHASLNVKDAKKVKRLTARKLTLITKKGVLSSPT